MDFTDVLTRNPSGKLLKREIRAPHTLIHQCDRGDYSLHKLWNTYPADPDGDLCGWERRSVHWGLVAPAWS
jgi:hypothetical protein